MALARNNGPRGPRFYMDGEDLKFVNVFDAMTCDGPRLATTADGEAHPKALEAFMAAVEPEARAMVQFETPQDADIPPEPKARGSKAPVA